MKKIEFPFETVLFDENINTPVQADLQSPNFQASI